MTSTSVLRLAAAAALAAALVPATAQETTKPQPVAGSCAKPEWPKTSLRLEEQGNVTMAFLVDAQGTITESKVAASSGFPMLDAATREALARCRFTPGTADGKPVAAWTQMHFAWSINPGPATQLERAYTTGGSDIKDMVAGMAEKGDQTALTEMTKAAVRGDVPAMAWMGTRYEEGKDVPADALAAVTWYRKAAQGGSRRARAALERLQPQDAEAPAPAATAAQPAR